MRSLSLLLLWAVAGLLTGCAMPSVRQRDKCQRQLRVLGRVITYVYPAGHDGMFPSNLSSVVRSVPFARHHLACPSKRRVIGDEQITGGRSCYEYVRYQSGTNTPDWFPLMYDRYVSNHDNAGVNILCVGGAVLWDYQVKWLRHFARGHPELRINVPTERPEGELGSEYQEKVNGQF